MVRHLAGLLLIGLLVGCTPNNTDPETSIGDAVPRSGQSFLDDPANFQFVIVGDRTGGHRSDVFETALSRVNLLQPEFVVSVGDLIEGYTDDPAKVDAEWEEFQGFLARLDMPFFFVAGNHDLSNEMMVEKWRERHGDTYYSFTYKGVLFIALNTEDPPYVFPPDLLARTQQMERAMAEDPDGTQARILEAVRDRPRPPKLPGAITMGEAQLAFVEQTLADNPDPRWTILLMHKPAWLYSSPEFARIEEMLGERDYTAIAGHEHYYAYDTRDGHDYIVMGTTGGVWLQDGPGRLDHVAWVTMTDDGPIFANIKVNCIFGKTGVDSRD